MLRPFAAFLLLAWTPIFVPGCGRRETIVIPRSSVQRFEVRGVLQKVRPEKPSAVIAHEKIPGYMEAMTMEFTVADARDLAGLHPGDPIAFRLTVTATQSIADQLTKIPGSSPVAISASDDPPPSIAPGSPLPNCRLIDAHGTAFQLHDLRGQTLAITFIFTRCPLPDFCPRLNRQFATTQAALQSSPDTPNWRLLSISLDPDFDTPERLATYAASFHPDPTHWIFATGHRTEIERLGATFGLAVKRDGPLPDHNLRTVVIGPDGLLRKILPGNEWTAAELTAEMRRTLQKN